MMLPLWVWPVTIAVILLLFCFDFVSHVRKAHVPSFRESIFWSLFYIVLALVFSAGMMALCGHQYGVEFLAGFITEKSLSVDNLFVFSILMSKFRVPNTAQQKALLIGIALALLMRGIFIAVGAAAIERFSWVFYLFGAFLLYTAIKLAIESFSSDEHEEEYQPNALVQFIGRHISMSREYDGNRISTHVDGKRIFTPMLIVVIALGITDVLFALDSIPAIYGLTQQAYIVFTANAFALLGLVQLFFLLRGLLQRLVYLGIGLSLILAFIGVKLVLHAMHENALSFINEGLPITWAPEIPTSYSLMFIVGVLAITTVASLVKSRNNANG